MPELKYDYAKEAEEVAFCASKHPDRDYLIIEDLEDQFFVTETAAREIYKKLLAAWEGEGEFPRLVGFYEHRYREVIKKLKVTASKRKGELDEYPDGYIIPADICQQIRYPLSASMRRFEKWGLTGLLPPIRHVRPQTIRAENGYEQF